MFAEFLNAESGAVTVDWTIMAAFVCGLALSVIGLLSAGAREPTSALNATLTSDVIGDHASFD
jgi:Flp pilus assembly pilin Flp